MNRLALKSGEEIELNQAFNCDCLEFMPLLPEKSIDMILCDLPYGTTACKWDTIIPFKPLWEQYHRIIKEDGAIILTASQPFTSALIMSNIKDFKYDYTWDKRNTTGFLNAKKMPLRQHEDICVFGKGTIKYNPQMRTGKLREKGGYNKNSECYGGEIAPIKNKNDQYYPTSIIKFYRGQQSEKIHPTQKPVKLFQYLIETYTDSGDLVLDNCAGSFTTPISAYNTGRKWIACEKDKQIYIDGYDRYTKETKQLLMDF